MKFIFSGLALLAFLGKPVALILANTIPERLGEYYSSGYNGCHLHLIRSATHLGPDFAFNSFSNPPFLHLIRSARDG